MKKIQVIVKDQNTLELKEAGNPGDYIDLTCLQEIDYALINKMIDDGKDKVYDQRLEEVKKTIIAENKAELMSAKSASDKKIDDLNNDLSLLKADKEHALKNAKTEYENKLLESKNELMQKITELNSTITSLKKESELQLSKEKAVIESKHLSEIADYKHQIDLLNSNKEKELEAVKNDFLIKQKEVESKFKVDASVHESKMKEQELINANKYNEEITKLKGELENLKSYQQINVDNLLIKKEQELKALNDEELSKTKKALEDRIKEQEEEILKLNFQRSIKNIKMTGEDLESWCDNEVKAYMQNGFTNCTWNKDNQVIKDDGDLSGSKADFIFKIYTTNLHKDLLASVCLEMKDENPDSTNKKKNDDYYKKLDINRNKKGCKYALLVSNLEHDRPNILPIYKVNEYDDMYVVRPAYLMTFLNMLVSLTNKFKDILMNVEKEKMELKASIDLTDEFEKLKNSYLDKPLDLLNKEIEAIQKSSESIKKSALSIDECCIKIIDKYIGDIRNKLDKFNIKKIKKGLEKLEDHDIVLHISEVVCVSE